MANALYNSFKKKALQGLVALDTDTIDVALVKSTYTPNIDTDTFWSDVSANEATGTGYTAGGAALASKALTVDTANDLVKFTAADTSWPSSTVTARYAVIYKNTGTASTSPLIGYIDFGADKTTSGDTFYIQWDATNGILKLT
jgi:hypothetical protein